MFVGKYYNSIDSKSRVIVPAKFRLELGSRCIVAKALDKCLTVYPFEQWENSLTRSWNCCRSPTRRQDA